MAADDLIRASDNDRDVVVAVLREAYTAGRLTLDEFDERMTAAYASRTWGDLRMLTADLPSQPVLGGDVPGLLPAGLLEQSPALRLPACPPRTAGTPTPQRNPLPILIPIAVWTVLAVHAGGAAPGFLVLSMVLLAVVLSAFRRR